MPPIENPGAGVAGKRPDQATPTGVEQDTSTCFNNSEVQRKEFDGWRDSIERRQQNALRFRLKLQHLFILFVEHVTTVDTGRGVVYTPPTKDLRNRVWWDMATDIYGLIFEKYTHIYKVLLDRKLNPQIVFDSETYTAVKKFYVLLESYQEDHFREGVNFEEDPIFRRVLDKATALQAIVTLVQVSDDFNASQTRQEDFLAPDVVATVRAAIQQHERDSVTGSMSSTKASKKGKLSAMQNWLQDTDENIQKLKTTSTEFTWGINNKWDDSELGNSFDSILLAVDEPRFSEADREQWLQKIQEKNASAAKLQVSAGI